MEPTSESTALEGAQGFVEYAPAGKLKGNKALITGGEWVNHDHAGITLTAPSSGIGRSVAVLFAREGSDVTIVYLPEEEEDAKETKRLVEKEGHQCLLVPGNLMDNATCKRAVDKHVEK